MVDAIYIQQCKNGEAPSYKKIYEATAPYLFTIIKNYISDEEYRRDILQETFAAVFSSIQNYDEKIGEFKHWIAKIAVYQCISFLRKNSKMTFDYSLSAVEEFMEDDYFRLDELSKKEIEDLLSSMPLGYKTVFLLHVLDDYSHSEIAALLNITAETSRSQLMRGIGWIKKNISLTTSNKLAYGKR